MQPGGNQSVGRHAENGTRQGSGGDGNGLLRLSRLKKATKIMKIETDVAEKKALNLVMGQAKDIAKLEVPRITSQQAAVDAGDVLAKIKAVAKRVDEEKHKVLDPLNEARTNFLNFFKPVETALEDAKSRVSAALLRFKNEVDAETAKQKKEVEAKVATGEISFEKAAAKIERVERKTEVVRVRKVQDIEITDESKIPDEFWVIDRVRLKFAVLEAAEKGIEIPGVKKVVKEIPL